LLQAVYFDVIVIQAFRYAAEPFSLLIQATAMPAPFTQKYLSFCYFCVFTLLVTLLSISLSIFSAMSSVPV